MWNCVAPVHCSRRIALGKKVGIVDLTRGELGTHVERLKAVSAKDWTLRAFSA